MKNTVRHWRLSPTSSVRYLTAEHILVLHKDIIDQTGGSHGIRDVGLLASVVERPRGATFGREHYPEFWTKAAVYLHGIAMNHVFVDGNKRTSITAAARFLFINGYQFHVSNDEMEQYVLRVVVDRLDIEDIAKWFKLHWQASHSAGDWPKGQSGL